MNFWVPVTLKVMLSNLTNFVLKLTILHWVITPVMHTPNCVEQERGWRWVRTMHPLSGCVHKVTLPMRRLISFAKASLYNISSLLDSISHTTAAVAEWAKFLQLVKNFADPMIQ